MREMEFTIENNMDKLKVGQEISVTESKLPSSYYYTMEDALGMSGNYANMDRLKTTVGVVKEVRSDEKFNIAVLEFDE